MRWVGSYLAIVPKPLEIWMRRPRPPSRFANTAQRPISGIQVNLLGLLLRPRSGLPSAAYPLGLSHRRASQLGTGVGVPELLLNSGNGRHAAHVLEDADLEDELDALGGGNDCIPHRHTRLFYGVVIFMLKWMRLPVPASPTHNPPAWSSARPSGRVKPPVTPQPPHTCWACPCGLNSITRQASGSLTKTSPAEPTAMKGLFSDDCPTQPATVHSATLVYFKPLASVAKTCTRWFQVSVTYSRPSPPSARPTGSSSSPGCEPPLPNSPR